MYQGTMQTLHKRGSLDAGSPISVEPAAQLARPQRELRRLRQSVYGNTPSARAMGEAWRAGPLPMLPDDHAPWNEAWSNSIALCASVCDEKPGDLREWLTYYR